jgi:tetratricopeptide (TPR) repeat protein
LAFYLGKLLLPWKLAIDYGRTPEVAIQRGWVYLTWLAPLTLAGAVWFARRRAPGLVAGLLLAVTGLLPVLGLVRFDFQEFSTVGDHYLYLPMLGVAVMLSACLAPVQPKRWGLVAAVVLIALTVRSIVQAGHWQDSLTLARHTVNVNPASRTGNNNLAAALMERGKLAEALPAARTAVQLNPTDARARATFAAALAATGSVNEAEVEFREAVRLDPKDPGPAGALAALLTDLGRGDEAIAMAKHVLALSPASPDAHTFVGLTLVRFGHREQAREQFEAALRLDPNFVPARIELSKLSAR